MYGCTDVAGLHSAGCCCSSSVRHMSVNTVLWEHQRGRMRVQQSVNLSYGRKHN